jgi:ERCC4-related helicase
VRETLEKATLDLDTLITDHILGNNITPDIFEVDKYQMYVCASSVVTKERTVFVTIPSGQGKTLIMAQNALYELEKNKRKNVCFVTCNEVLMN